jgi:23S rRNA (adenine-N6)-dimethyltransferase
VAVRRARRAGRHAQHFLRSSGLAADIVRCLDVRADELVVEIGAGSGRLTAELARRARHVVAIEIDPSLAARLRKRFPRVEIVEADALQVPLPPQPFRAVGNVPFNRTTAILRRLLDNPRTPLVRADLIVEWDLARKRAAVWPGTLLGVSWSPWYELVVVRRLPARCFEPAPSVDAALLRITRRPVSLVEPSSAREFRDFVSAAFSRGRLAGLVPALQLKRAAGQLGFDPRAAPRELDVHQWAALYRTVSGVRDVDS